MTAKRVPGISASSTTGWMPRWSPIPLLLIATLALTACGFGMTRTVVKTPPPAMPQPKVDAALLQPCQELPPAKSGRLPDLQRNHLQVTAAYHDCADRHQQTIQAVKTLEATQAAHAASSAPAVSH